MSEINYNTTAWGEVKVDVYAGENCDQHRPYIEACCEGDMDSEQMDDFSFDAKRWPPGTKIRIEVPCCPKCEHDAEFADENGICQCGEFDWKNWAEEQYS